MEINGEVRYNEAFAILQRNVIDFTEDVINRTAFPSAESSDAKFQEESASVNHHLDYGFLLKNVRCS